MKNSKDNDNRLWSGRFSEKTDELVEEFTASVNFDKRLFFYDIQGSIAHAKMLEKVGVLTASEREQIVQGLIDIQQDIERDDFNWSVSLEDVHMNIESRLTSHIGEVGKKLHTGRSRNDQVATDIRLYLRDQVDLLISELEGLMLSLINLAEKEYKSIMPGFTHLQVAQPVTFGHHVLAWFEMIFRDAQRLLDCRKRINLLPLGSAALAGTTFPIDRAYTAELLGFDGVCENSLDAVSDRDFAIEFCSFASILMMHLSRFSEELVIWSSAQFNFVDIADRFCTGSSIMPQKKNPDVPELIRGKTGRVFGDLTSLLTLMKGQTLAYNKDNQEDKEPLFDAVDTVSASVLIYAKMLEALSVNRDKMRAAALTGYSTATDLADYLVSKDLPFRDAHEVVGKIVGFCVEKSLLLTDLSLDQYQEFSGKIEKDVFDVLTLDGSVAARDHVGGTAPSQVISAVGRARVRLKNLNVH